MNKKKVRYIVLFISVFLLLGISISLFLYQERYFECITIDVIRCLQSKKYESVDGTFVFRYPNGYPLSYITRNELISKYKSFEEYDERINFSKEFYPNAGGPNLGAIDVRNDVQSKDIKDYVTNVLDVERSQQKFHYTTLGGKEAACSELLSHPSSFGAADYRCYVIANDKLYTVMFFYGGYDNDMPREYYKLGPQFILSTLSIK